MKKKLVCLLLACTMPAAVLLSGCSAKNNDGKIEIELVHYKPEAVDVFEKLEEKFNSTHDNIRLTISSPNDAMTVLKTRFVREDYPDILGIGGDITIISFDAVHAALEMVAEGTINVDIECNPNQGEVLSRVIGMLEDGEEVEQQYYVEEDVFTIKNVTQEVLQKRNY